MLDSFHARADEPNEGYVIYAPHYSVPISGIKRAFNIGTFLENGRTILSYAQRHSEIKWVFKPHPNLAWTLVNQAGWTQNEVNDYYKAWERIGMGCYDGSYPTIFRRSKAMITDSASFLFEYPATGKPLIHLVFPDIDFSRNIPEVRPVLESYYRAENEEQMLNLFKMVLEEGRDPKHDERLSILRKVGMSGVNAAENIVNYLKRELAVW
jgi:CDP-glycerol glycerophosphotransferase (TagB/SpsB family)